MRRSVDGSGASGRRCDAGFIVVGPEDDDIAAPRGQVFVINVDPDHWGSGIAGELFDAGVAALRRFGFESAVLWVLPGNDRARAFYERRGWAPDGAIKTETILEAEVTEIRYVSNLGEYLGAEEFDHLGDNGPG